MKASILPWVGSYPLYPNKGPGCQMENADDVRGRGAPGIRIGRVVSVWASL